MKENILVIMLKKFIEIIILWRIIIIVIFLILFNILENITKNGDSPV